LTINFTETIARTEFNLQVKLFDDYNAEYVGNGTSALNAWTRTSSEPSPAAGTELPVRHREGIFAGLLALTCGRVRGLLT
jgi:hypothetical protein